MTDSLIDRIRENVIQGRVTKEDEGLEEGMVGQPGVTELVREALAQNADAKVLVNDGLTSGMEVVGKRFESGEYFLPDMLASAEAVGAATEILTPHLAASGIQSKGTILVATVKGDLHDIGKNIVSTLLRGAGYTVNDLGNDIDAQTIVDAVKRDRPEFLGLSALLTSTMANMEEVVQALVDNDVRDSVKIVIGGAPVSEEFAKRIGADGYGGDAFQAVAVVEALRS